MRHIREIAVSFHRNYDLLANASFDMPSDQATEGERDAVLLPVLELLRRFAIDYAHERKADGEVEFQDLLVLARDLLRDSLSARDHFRGRYSHILIDEVQDTDPLQAELAMFLAEDVPEGVELTDRPMDWWKVRPAAGKLFIVGDAKQSIYRFRRADIRQVKLMQQLVGGSNVLLTRNFRSLPPVIDWVNHVFPQWMKESEGQARYSPLGAEPSDGEPPPVRYMGGAIGGNIGDVRRQEADAVARTIRTAVKEGWQVRSEDLGPETRPAKYQDVCVLMPSRLGLDALEFAFETAGIPYRLDSAGLIYESQEARDLLNCLGAIDDPTDQVSVVAALRSPALACSDADLLDFVESGGQFDYLADDDTPSGYATDALAILRDFHGRRRWMSPAALIEEFVRERRLMELALDGRNWRGRWMRYRFLIDRARAFAASGETSLRAYLAWTARQREEQARARETAVPESDEDAVRVMTVHGAKGLEFPILVLAGLNSSGTRGPGAVLFDHKGGRVEVKVGSRESSFQTAGYEDLAESDKTREQEQDVRLMYVAATRARDHLIVSLYRNSRGKNSPAARFEEFMEGADHLWEPFEPPTVEEERLSPDSSRSHRNFRHRHPRSARPVVQGEERCIRCSVPSRLGCGDPARSGGKRRAGHPGRTLEARSCGNQHWPCRSRGAAGRRSAYWKWPRRHREGSGRSRGSAGPRGRHCPARSPSARQSPRQARAGIGAMVEGDAGRRPRRGRNRRGIHRPAVQGRGRLCHRRLQDRRSRFRR